MPHSVASHLGLHCLPITLLWVSRLQWVKAVFQPVSIDIFLFLHKSMCSSQCFVEALLMSTHIIFWKKYISEYPSSIELWDIFYIKWQIAPEISQKWTCLCLSCYNLYKFILLLWTFIGNIILIFGQTSKSKESRLRSNCSWLISSFLISSGWGSSNE